MPTQPRPVPTTTVTLARDVRTVRTSGESIVLFDGDVAQYRSLRVDVLARVVVQGGLMIQVFEVEDPARPIRLYESVAEEQFAELHAVFEVPGRRVRVHVWVDDIPGGGDVALAYGIWGRPD